MQMVKKQSSQRGLPFFSFGNLNSRITLLFQMGVKAN